jgi:hypothetical protein
MMFVVKWDMDIWTCWLGWALAAGRALSGKEIKCGECGELGHFGGMCPVLRDRRLKESQRQREALAAKKAMQLPSTVDSGASQLI